ncbi:MAG: beta-propeller fold lactonase family protein [Mucilaginibacter sp.]|nr:beta-propeller fold lactonase family protein [Mucilaginibacter sp.]
MNRLTHTEPNYTISYLLFVLILVCAFLSPLKLQAQTDQTVPNGGTVADIIFPATGCVYNWRNSNPAIGIPVSGAGNIASFKAVNTGVTPIKATITASTTPIGPYGYVFENTTTPKAISIVDLKTFAEVKNTPFYGLVDNPVVSPDGNSIYLPAVPNINSVGIFNTATNTIMPAIPMPPEIKYVASVVPSPDGSRLYVTGYQDQSIAVVNTATNSIESVLDLKSYHASGSYLMVSNDGSKLYIPGDGGLLIVSAVTYKILSTINLSFFMLVMSPDGSKIYATNNSTVNVIDTRTDAVSSFNTGVNADYLLKITKDNTYLFLLPEVYSGKIYKVNVQTKEVKAISIASNPNGNDPLGNVFVSPDGRYVYVTDITTGLLNVIDTQTNTTVSTVMVNPEITRYNSHTSSHEQFSTDGSELYITTLTYSDTYLHTFVTLVNTATNKVEKTLDIPYGSTFLVPPSKIACDDPPVTLTITIDPDPPTINVDASGLTSVSTTYGTPSDASSFTVSGIKINTGILVTAPAGFEVSIDNNTYSDVVTAGTDGTIDATKVYIRLKATDPVNDYSGQITLSSGVTSIFIPVSASGAVSQAPLTITARNVSKTYGTTITDVTGSTDFTDEGLKNGETIGTVNLAYGMGSDVAVGTGTYTGSVTPSAPAGGTFTESNYTITPVNGNIIVTPAPLTITADNLTRYYQEDNPVLTFKYSGFVNNEDASQLTDLPVISTTAVPASAVGQYPITVSGASAANYTMNYMAGTLTVAARPITMANTITPNGDGINDTWEIKYISEYPNCTVEILNRYGKKVYYSNGYVKAWDGKLNGANLPIGTYYYIINLSNDTKPISGYLAIIR